MIDFSIYSQANDLLAVGRVGSHPDRVQSEVDLALAAADFEARSPRPRRNCSSSSIELRRSSSEGQLGVSTISRKSKV